MQLMRTALALELGVGDSMGGCKCSHQAANGLFLGRNLRHREAVFSNYYLPAMDRYSGFSVRSPVFRTRGVWSL